MFVTNKIILLFLILINFVVFLLCMYHPEDTEFIIFILLITLGYIVPFISIVFLYFIYRI